MDLAELQLEAVRLPPRSSQTVDHRAFFENAWVSAGILVLYCGILFFYGLSSGEFYRTESLRAIVAEEFLRSGNWIVPTLYGEPIFTKPPGMYAAIALMSLGLGHVTEWSARAPSALAATITVFAFWAVFRRRLGPLPGLLAALILPCSLMWLDKGNAAEIDMMQVAWVSGAVLCFLRALEFHEAAEAESPRVSLERVDLLGHPLDPAQEPTRNLNSPKPNLWFWWIAALLCVAGGVLTKWTAPAFFYGTVIPMLLLRGRLRLLFSKCHLVAASVAGGICLAWVVAAVALAGWPLLYETVSREALQRLLPHQAHRPYPWGDVLLHPVRVFVSNLPWSIPALLTLRPGFQQLWREPARRLLLLMHCWLWPNLVFWTVIQEHATRQSFPMFPAVAGLSAFVVAAWIDGKLSWRLSRICGPATLLTAFLILVVAGKLTLVHIVAPARTAQRQARATGEKIASLVPGGKTLYLSHLKDEGVLFYYGRPALRFTEPGQLFHEASAAYCLFDAADWELWRRNTKITMLEQLCDEQGDPIYLVIWRI